LQGFWLNLVIFLQFETNNYPRNQQYVVNNEHF